MTVLLSALSRYHVFDLALELKRYDVVEALVTAYPKFGLKSYSDLAECIISVPKFALLRESVIRAENIGFSVLSQMIAKKMYSNWSVEFGSVAASSPAAVVYGLSGYMAEAIQALNGKGKITVVDHGSLHISTEKSILDAECERYGFKRFGNWQHDWLVERMKLEFSTADYVVCCSELAKSTMIENGVDEKKIVVQKLGVNLSEFFPNETKRPHVKGGRVRLLFVGAMTPLKGLHRLLEAFLELDESIELWMVGALPTDRILRAKIEHCVKKTGRIKVTGPVPQRNLRQIYSECDIFVMPSLCDGWGMVVNQAMACGLPVVVSDMTGAKECVEEGVTGYIFDSRSKEDLIEKLKQGMKMANDKYTFGYGGNSHSLITWDEYGRQWRSWLNSICA